MKRVLIFAVFFLMGLAFALSVSYFTPQIIQNLPRTHIATQFSLVKAPRASLQGKVASMSGTVDWLSRIATKAVPLKPTQMIQQGEELSTSKNGKVLIQLNNVAALSLSPNSHVNFIQLLPINIVFAQDGGNVTYLAAGSGVVSVRTLDLLTLISRGEMSITVDKDTNSITVNVIKGTVQEGYVDSQNVSNVATVEAGQQYIFDNTTKNGITKGVAIKTPSFLNR